MIYAVDENGPWVDLDEVVGVTSFRGGHTVGDVRITFRNGIQEEAICSIEAARKLGRAWIDHKADEEGDDRPKRRSTL